MKSHIAFVALCVSPLLLLAVSSANGQQAASDETALETIVVTGTQPIMESERLEVAMTPGGAHFVNLDDFRERNVSSLADVLRYVPGVWSTSDNGNDGIFFSSRGSNLDATDYDMNGIKLMQDGLPVTTADGNNHNRIIDPLSARFATVARGANALKYGASTLGGAINFITPTAHDGPPLDVSLNGGSHGQILGRATVRRVFDNRVDGLLTLEAKRWDGFRDHNAQNRRGLYANLGWQLSEDVATRFYTTILGNDQQLPGSLTRAQLAADPDQANPSALGGNFQLDVETARLANKTSWLFSGNRRLDIGFSIEDQSLFHPIVDRVLVDFDGPGPAEPVEVFSLLIDTDHRDVGTVLRFSQQVGVHDLLLGLNYGKNSVNGGNYRNLGGIPNGLTTLVDNEATLLEAFAMDRWQLNDRLSVVLAAQIVSAEREVRSTDIATSELRNPKDDYSSVNPRIGMLFRPRETLTLYTNLSRLFEAPTNFELEDNLAGGDATLEAMEGTVFEIGARGGGELDAGGNWGWDVSLYYAAIDDEILSIEDPNALGTSLVTNIDKTTHSGIEALFSANLALSRNRSVEPLVSVTLNDFSFDNDAVYGSNDLPAAPDYVVRGEVIYRHGNGFYIGPTFELVGDRYADFVNSYTVDSYHLLGLRAGWSDDRWTVYADLRNLSDERYVTNHSVRNIATPEDAILNPGEPLSAYFGVQRQFE
jgi:iron complex outermembrane receptor protein